MTASAHGLFRAVLANRPPVDAAAPAKVRVPFDFHATPPEATVALLAAERARLDDFGCLWEPAAGDGAMLRVLREAGLTVHASDLVERGCGAEIRDFYGFDTAPAPAIVTNPPFSEVNWKHGKGRWLRHGLGTLDVDYMALLLPWTFPAAAGLGPLWAAHPPARLYLMRWRLPFTGRRHSPMTMGWFVWDRAHRGDVVVRMMDRPVAAVGVVA